MMETQPEGRTTRRAVLTALGAGGLVAGVGGVSLSAGSQHAPDATSDSWTQYMRDARNTGYNPDASGPTEDVEARWTFGPPDTASDDGSNGFTAPVLADDTLYVGGHERLWALDPGDGSRKWQYNPQHPEPSDGDILAVGVADGTVYVGTDRGRVAAVDAADGTEQWRDPVGSGEHEGETVQIRSLTVADRTVLAAEDGTMAADSILHALDAETGEQRWTYNLEGEGEAGRVPPAPAVADGTAFAIGMSEFVALDVHTGEARWKRDDVAYASSTPAVVDGTVYTPDEESSGTFYALNAEDGSTEWTAELGRNFVSWRDPAVGDGTVYSGYFDGDSSPRLFALDASDGSELWTEKVEDVGATALDGEAVYVNTRTGTGVHARVPDDGEQLWSYDDVEDPSAPAVVGETVYVGGATRVVALESAGTPTPTETDTATETDTPSETDTATDAGTGSPATTETGTATGTETGTPTGTATSAEGSPSPATGGGPGLGVLGTIGGLASVAGYYLYRDGPDEE